ncbi:MAG TPA: S8 family serine peptidase, partial [Solirubrobacteraceae bacterium]|nr:S8 family serine peptidase [Solirubrobacteraceae bacterium]
MAASVLGLTATAAGAPGPVIPNDSSFAKQWGDLNTGQQIPGQRPPEELVESPVGGLAGADDRLTEAWEITTGSSEVVVAVLDTGVDYTNANLAANIWTNPTGVGGCPKGAHGLNVLGPLRCDPMDTELVGYRGHGTHVAGIIGAVGNTGSEVAGVNWHTTLLPVRWLDTAGNGHPENLVTAVREVIA